MTHFLDQRADRGEVVARARARRLLRAREHFDDRGDELKLVDAPGSVRVDRLPAPARSRVRASAR